jgi:hypothetical protein
MHYAERKNLQNVQTLWSSKRCEQLQSILQQLVRFSKRRHSEEDLWLSIERWLPRDAETQSRRKAMQPQAFFAYATHYDLATNLGE